MTRSDSSPEPAAQKAGKRRVERTRHAGRVAILGRPNVGKSTLLNLLLGQPIAITSPHPQTTRDQILGILTDEGDQFVFLDTPGIHSARNKLGVLMNERADEAAREADVVLFVVDATKLSNGLTEADARALEHVGPRAKVICVVNKIDKVKEKAKLLPVFAALAERHAFEAFVPISARTGDGRDSLLEEARKFLPEGTPLYPEDELSDRPVRFFVAEFVREQILRKTRQEVPHGVAVVVEHFDESRPVPRIDLVIHVDKESHKPIIIGKGGALLKAVGTEARANVEAMLGKQVHLELRVRVTPRWYESEGALKDMGYGTDGGASSS